VRIKPQVHTQVRTGQKPELTVVRLAHAYWLNNTTAFWADRPTPSCFLLWADHPAVSHPRLAVDLAFS